MSERPFKITVSIISETPSPDGGREVQQSVLLEEYSDTVDEHVVKNFHIADAVTLATNGAMKELAEAAGYPTGISKVKPGGKPA